MTNHIHKEVWIYKLAQSTLNCLTLFLSCFFSCVGLPRILPGCEALWSVGGRLRLVTCVSSSRTPGSASPRNERKPALPWRFQNFKRNFPPAFWEKTFKDDFKSEKFVHVTQLSKARFAPISPLLLTWPETSWEIVMYLNLKAVVLALLSSFYIFLLPDMICDSSLTIPRRRCNIVTNVTNFLINRKLTYNLCPTDPPKKWEFIKALSFEVYQQVVIRFINTCFDWSIEDFLSKTAYLMKYMLVHVSIIQNETILKSLLLNHCFSNSV